MGLPMAARGAGARWSRLVTEWKRSGLTARQFASKRKIAPSTLSWWAWRLRRQGALPGEEAGSGVELVSVEVDESQTDGGGWELSLPGGAVLRVEGPLEPASLREILSTVTRRRRRR